MFNRFVWSAVVSLCVVSAISESVADAQQSSPKGYVADVTDTAGTKLTVSAFSLGYTYGYWRSNCIGACGASAESTIVSLPLNEGCGATMVPLSKIRSISGISRSTGKELYQATVTLADGRELKSKFGSFGGQSLRTVRGTSALGDYAVPLEKVSQITFVHEKDSSPLPEEEWGSSDSKATATLTCSDGSTYSLTKAALYAVGDRGTAGSYTEKTLSVKVGESEIKMDFDRVRTLNRSVETGEKFDLSTSTGETIAVLLTDGNRYIGGERDGNFYFVSLTDLKNLTVTR